MKKIFAGTMAALLTLAASWPATAQPLWPRADASILAGVLGLSQTDEEVSRISGSLTHCGTSSNPVVYITSSGSFEYRWCVNLPRVSAWMDVYSYVNGSPIPKGSYSIACGSGMPSKVSRAVEC